MNRPQIFMHCTPSWGVPWQSRTKARIALMDSIEKEYSGLYEGFWIRFRWDELDNQERRDRALKPILEALKERGKKLVIHIKDRNFGGNKYSLPIPDDVEKLGTQFKSNIHSGLVWYPKYIDYQVAFMMELKDYIKVVPNGDRLAELQWGESSIYAPNHEEYKKELLRLYSSGAGIVNGVFDLGAQVNWLSGLDRVQDLVDNLDARVSLSCPDAAPNHFTGVETGPVKLDKVHGLQAIEEAYKDSLVSVGRENPPWKCSPHIEPWDMHTHEFGQSMRLCTQRLGATRLLIPTTFESRVQKGKELGVVEFAKLLKPQLVDFFEDFDNPDPVEDPNDDTTPDPVEPPIEDPIEDPNDGTQDPVEPPPEDNIINLFVSTFGDRETAAVGEIFDWVGSVRPDNSVAEQSQMTVLLLSELQVRISPGKPAEPVDQVLVSKLVELFLLRLRAISEDLSFGIGTVEIFCNAAGVTDPQIRQAVFDRLVEDERVTQLVNVGLNFDVNLDLFFPE